MKIGLDFETYSDVDLKKHGLARYLASQNFTPLIVSQAWQAGPDVFTDTVDFIADKDHALNVLRNWISDKTIVAQNAPFERGVLSRIGIHLPASRFIDSAVVARAAGAGGSLEAGAAQLLDADKMEVGKNLIKVFSVPGKYQEENGNGAFDPRVVADNPVDWKMFAEYCELDAKLGFLLEQRFGRWLTDKEQRYAELTMEMNDVGWNVDVETVKEMERRYQENLVTAVERFRATHNLPDLNFNSYPQQLEFCKSRGIKARSFDEAHVASMLKRLEKKLDAGGLTPEKEENYMAVTEFLRVKQMLGGSSLSKLSTILNMVSSDGRLRDQYLHCGAGQTLRSTGRGVQMQNLKRLDMDNIGDMDTLMDDAVDWTNSQMARNLRQVFTATNPDGFLLVGDFKGVENRGLAWMAGQADKLAAFRRGEDPYKMLASKMYGTPYDAVTGEQRQFGKVGELSCGYQAGPGAVVDFAAKMGMELTEGEATKLVYDWRDANPNIVDFWDALDEMLRQCVGGHGTRIEWTLPDGYRVRIYQVDTPLSLLRQEPRGRSICMEIYSVQRDETFLKRYFHGCYVLGREVRYFKPSERKTGDLWRAGYIHPKTGQWTPYTLYGGKLAGILTQSLCREIFFHSLNLLRKWTDGYDTIAVIGQFHDEIVVDWEPGQVDLEGTKANMKVAMCAPGPLRSFPLDADIKHAYRYTK